jgi:predicted RNA binding protein YcfA (HicA-like mRNA interferase family)
MPQTIRVPRTIDGVELTRLLIRRLGFVPVSTGNHVILRHPAHNGHVSVPRNVLRIGIIRGLLNEVAEMLYGNIDEIIVMLFG